MLIRSDSFGNSCFCDGDKVSLSNKVMKSMFSIALLRFCSKARASDFTLEVIRVAACVTSRLYYPISTYQLNFSKRKYTILNLIRKYITLYCEEKVINNFVNILLLHI